MTNKGEKFFEQKMDRREFLKKQVLEVLVSHLVSPVLLLFSHLSLMVRRKSRTGMKR